MNEIIFSHSEVFTFITAIFGAGFGIGAFIGSYKTRKTLELNHTKEISTLKNNNFLEKQALIAEFNAKINALEKDTNPYMEKYYKTCGANKYDVAFIYKNGKFFTIDCEYFKNGYCSVVGSSCLLNPPETA